MHAIRFTSFAALAPRLCAKARHAEPQRHARRRDDREAAERRIKAAESAIRTVLYGPLHTGAEL